MDYFFEIQKYEIGINSNEKSECFRENNIFSTIIAHHFEKIDFNKNKLKIH
jgi:hypothetical protein